MFCEIIHKIREKKAFIRISEYRDFNILLPPVFIIAQGAFELRDLQYLYVRIQNYTGVLLLL